MTVVVLTADQRASRTGPDLVPWMLEIVNDPELPPALLSFERASGDEIQGVLDSGPATVMRLVRLLRDGRWRVGIGFGAVEAPLPDSTRAGRGEAFIAAREAVGRAERTPAHVGAAGPDARRAEHIETAALLLAGVLSRRTERGWEAVDLIEQGLTPAQAAQRLGIGRSALSQRLQAAGLVESTRAARLLSDLLDQALGNEADR